MDDTRSLRREVAAILQQGIDVRRHIAALVARTARSAFVAGTGLLGIAGEVVDAAASCVAAAATSTQTAALRQAIDGLVDGFGLAAQAAQLAMLEVTSVEASRWRADLSAVADAFDAVARRFVDAVVDAAAAALPLTGTQMRSLRDHARVNWVRSLPAFLATASAARSDRLALAKETLHAGGAAPHGTAGALFDVIGRRLQQLGEQLQQSGESSG